MLEGNRLPPRALPAPFLTFKAGAFDSETGLWSYSDFRRQGTSALTSLFSRGEVKEARCYMSSPRSAMELGLQPSSLLPSAPYSKFPGCPFSPFFLHQHKGCVFPWLRGDAYTGLSAPFLAEPSAVWGTCPPGQHRTGCTIKM